MAPPGIDLTGQIKLIKSGVHVLYDPIGTGAFTNVFRAEWKKKGNTSLVMVAVKTWRLSLNANQEAVNDLNRRLLRESKVWSQLQHVNVLPYHGYCSGLCASYGLVSPLCELGTVMPYLRENPSADRLKLLLDVLAGLEYLHANKTIIGSTDGIIVHGDLSSNNVLIDENHNACLSDFGRARIVGDPQYSTALAAGSLPYMAPELLPEDDAETDKLFTVHSDMYAFGILAFEVLVDRLPLGSKIDFRYLKLAHGKKKLARPSKGDEGRLVTDALWKMMQECWVKVPEKRPSAEALAKRITGVP